jgi:farnesyl-diphosphate farnesyltransferase
MGHAPSPADSSGNLAWCHEVVQDVSRTFAITIDVLDEPMSSSICVGYLLCRIPDTIEDAGHIPPEEQVRLLELYDGVLDGTTEVEAFVAAASSWLPEDDDADWELVASADRVLGAFRHRPERVRDAIAPPTREMVSGMRAFVDRYAADGGLRIETRSELHEYCYYVAGTVGEMITNLVTTSETDADARQVMDETAGAFGRALQLVNVCKDVGADFREENNVYLPSEELAAEGVPQDGITRPAHEEGVVAVVQRTVADARGCLDQAQRYLEHMPTRDGNRTAAWAIPFLLAVGTLREIESRPAEVLTSGGVKVSRSEVAAVIDRTADGVDPANLGDLRERIATEPFA